MARAAPDGIGLPQLDSTFRHRPYRAAGPNAALGEALSHRREDRNAIAARWGTVSSIDANIDYDSHNSLLDIPISRNDDLSVQRSSLENKSQHAAIVFNTGRYWARNPIQTIARRVAKMPDRPMLVIGDRDRTTELDPRHDGIRMNIIILLQCAGVDERIELQQAIEYTWKDTNAAARSQLSRTFPVNIRKRR